jgi:crotonobetainyl-CoA:carnitine CoA-transferase CaiB-like acyl-CoA transferase
MTESPRTDLAPGALSGIRVADFSRVLAGPYATMMLADFGADVIKIESPEGDETRAWMPPVDARGGSSYFGSVNRGKRSVVCDLATEVGLARARRFAESADVVIENFRPGVMARYGLDFDTVRAANPRVVYCTITGFGNAGGAQLAGYDLLVQALGGLMSVTGHPEGGPTKVGVALVDVLTGLNAFSGILLGLRARDAEGEAQHVQVDLFSTLLSGLVNQAGATLATGVSPTRLGNAHPSIAPYEVFHAADRELVIAVGNDKQFAALAATVSLDGLAADPRFARNPDRVANRAELRSLIEGVLADDTAAAWTARLGAAGVPAGLVNTIGEAFDFAASLGLDPVVELADPAGGAPLRQVANPIHLGGSAARYDRVPPALGEHADAEWLPREGTP